jgi:WD40 repeat protein
VQAVAFSPDSRTAASSGDDGLVIVWDPATGQPIQRLVGHAGRVPGLSFSPDGKTLYSASLDGAIFKWALGTTRRFGRPFTTSAAPQPVQLGRDTPQTPPLAVSPDGARFAVRVGSSRVALYSTSTLRRLAAFTPGPGDVTGIAWSPKGALGVTGPSGRVQLWNVDGTPRLVRKLVGLGSVNSLPESVTAISFSADGTRVAAGDVNHTPGATANPLATVAVWDAATGKRLWTVRTQRIGVGALPFSPDGTMIAPTFGDGTVSLLDARDGRVERTLKPEGAGPFTFQSDAFSHDGKVLATGTWAGIVQLWNPHSGQEIGHPTLVEPAPVASIDFAPSDETFATAGGSDGLAKLWTTATQQQFGATFPGSPNHWTNAVHTPDGSSLIVVYDDGTGDIWPVDVQNWEDHACALAGRNLTREEWARFVSGHAYARTCPSLPAG